MAPILISTVSLLLSLTVAWLTLFRRGRLGMTRPVLVGFLTEERRPKLFLRGLLYASGKRGYIVESLFLKLRRGDVSQIFDFWMYGERKAEMIGSGLRVGEDGAAFNHYFLPPKDDTFRFLAGEYVIEVHAKILSRKKPVVLSTVNLSLSEKLAAAFGDPGIGVLFSWMPDLQSYRSDVNTAPAAGRARSASGAGRGELPWA